MSTFEEGFADTERAAVSAALAAGEIVKVAKALERAAKTGSINAIRKAQSDLTTALNTLRQEVANATEAWPFEPSSEQAYLRESFPAELREEAARLGLEIHDREERLIAHPSMVRILPSNLAVRIDKKQTSTIRPSYLAALLVTNQKKPSKFNPQQFLESLYEAYLALTASDTADRLKLGQVGQAVRLNRIYNLFTGLPGAKRDYSLLDFARDLYSLESSEVREVRPGARVTFPASTGTRNPGGTISFVGPNGETILYYAIQFSGVAK